MGKHDEQKQPTKSGFVLNGRRAVPVNLRFAYLRGANLRGLPDEKPE